MYSRRMKPMHIQTRSVQSANHPAWWKRSKTVMKLSRTSQCLQMSNSTHRTHSQKGMICTP
ncbi:hypothetical protein Lalb_Chr23g0268311 [Lupinus albus]|uniref:Uncharacterized protein n=1 Tax=Lupinus albus TaxID=3870 RepID=A0A6A4N6P6_LUPAL|nr:hypothetical protein Lalb_Chr23g0268311 [Lupinus albus]